MSKNEQSKGTWEVYEEKVKLKRKSEFPNFKPCNDIFKGLRFKNEENSSQFKLDKFDISKQTMEQLQITCIDGLENLKSFADDK